MLTPGLRKRAENQQGGSISSVFARFGGGKFRLAARKMRVLDDSKLGHLHPDALKDFSQNIPVKFREVKKLIHFTPGSFRKASIWSEIDRTLPNQAESRSENPPLPGELRPGSIIEKMPMTPQSGQSIGSFKEQLQQFQPSTPQQKPLRRPDPGPGSRLFSRIQEITGQDQSPEVSSPGITEAEVKPPAAESKPTSTQGATVQRQIDSSPIPEAQTPVEPVSESRDDIIGTPPAQQEMPTEGGEIETSVPVQPSSATEALEGTGVPVVKAAIPTPVRPRLKIARQVEVVSPTKPAPRVLPKAKPASIVETGPPDTTPPAASRLPAASLVQRKPDTPEKSPKPKPTPATVSGTQAKPPILPQKMETGLQDETDTGPLLESRTKPFLARLPEQTGPTLPETGPAAAKAIPAAFRPTPTSETDQILTAGEDQVQVPLEMPLLKTIETRRQSTRIIKAPEPEMLTPRRTPPISLKSERSLNPVTKYPKKKEPGEKQPGRVSPPAVDVEATAPVPAADIFPRSGSEAAPKVLRKDPGFRTEEAPPLLTEPLSMSLAYTRPTDRPSPQSRQSLSRTPAEIRPQIRQTQPQFESEAQTIKAPALKTTGAPIVQRIPDTPSETSPGETIRRIEEPEEGGEPDSPDLDKLAEDVLPLVKRILEIEAERLSNNFR